MRKPLVLLGVAVILSTAAQLVPAADRGGNGADVREARQLAAAGQQADSLSPMASERIAPDAAAPSMRRPASEK
ncbi:MAG: hypothetical protein JO338_03220 [Aquitalea sp.]|nr:hypothetical protein [Aquitalea sp.]